MLLRYIANNYISQRKPLMQDSQSTTRRTHLLAGPSHPSLLPSDPLRKARIVDDGMLNYDVTGYKVVEKAGDNG